MNEVCKAFFDIQCSIDMRTCEYKRINKSLRYLFGEIVMVYCMKKIPSEALDELYELTKSEFWPQKLVPRLEELKNERF